MEGLQGEVMGSKSAQTRGVEKSSWVNISMEAPGRDSALLSGEK